LFLLFTRINYFVFVLAKIRGYHVIEIKFCEMVFRKDEDFWRNVLWSDECTFYLNGYVNTQNCRIWGSSPPDTRIEKPLHSPKVTVWCGLSADSILPPYFFDSNVNAENYSNMILTYAIPELKKKRKFSHAILQQDGATPHTSLATRAMLKRQFGEERIISLHFPQTWPPRSPDINPCDFSLCDAIDSKSLANVDELKEAILTQISLITKHTLQNVHDNLFDRMMSLYSSEGDHIE
jgi:hypothetical protein